MLLFNYSIDGDLILVKNMPNNSIYEQISEWLDLYHAAQDSVKRSKLKSLIVMQMVPVVKNIARTIARRSYDPVDDYWLIESN